MNEYMDDRKMRSERGNSNSDMEKYHKDMEGRIAWRSQGYTHSGLHKRENTFGLGKRTLYMGDIVKERV